MGISVDLDDHIKLAEIASRHDDVGYSVGVHPCEDDHIMARATTDYLWNWPNLKSLGIRVKQVLDYYHSTDFIAESKNNVLQRHIQASKKKNQLLYIHDQPNTIQSIL